LGSFVEGGEIRDAVSDQAYWTSPPSWSVAEHGVDANAVGLAGHEGAYDNASAYYQWNLANKDFGQPSLGFSFNNSAAAGGGLKSALASREGEFFSSGAFVAPYEDLYSELSGASLSFVPMDNAKISLSGFIPSDRSEGARASLQKAELSYKGPADIEMRVGYGWMQEDEAWLGSRTSGAFGQGIEGASEFATASILAPLTDKLSLFGAYTHGSSDIAVSSGLISDWSKARSTAFGFGLLSGDLLAAGDHLSLMIGQPHRVSQGQATFTVPTATDNTGRVITETETVDLAPEGREIAIESTYRFQLGDEGELATGAFLRLEPNHNPEAEPDIGVGLRYQKRF
jgi:hypothetical protein